MTPEFLNSSSHIISMARLAAGVSVLSALVAIIRSYLRRNEQHKVTIDVDGRKIRLQNLSTTDVNKIIQDLDNVRK